MVEIRGTYEDVHAVHAALFAALFAASPSRFAIVPLSPGAAYSLSTRWRQCSTWLQQSPNLVVEPTEQAIYVTGDPHAVGEVVVRVNHMAGVVAARNRLIPVDPALIGQVIGRKGRRIQQIAITCGVHIEVLPSRDALLLVGEPSAVDDSYHQVERVIESVNAVNMVIRPTPSVLSSFKAMYQDLVLEWEREYGGKIDIDETQCFIRIYGSIPANVRGLSSVIENVLEAVELEEEKDKEREDGIEIAKADGNSDLLCMNPVSEEETDQRVNEGRITSERHVIASKEDSVLRIELLLGLTRNDF